MLAARRHSIRLSPSTRERVRAGIAVGGACAASARSVARAVDRTAVRAAGATHAGAEQRMGFRPVEGSQRTNRTGGTSITMKLDLHE